MKKILAFAGSNHSKSINYQLVEYTASLFSENEVTVLDIRDWYIPMYSIDMDPDETPPKISELLSLIADHDGYILSSPEYNGSTPAFLKNILEWLSRRGDKVFDNKPMLLMSTSPGAGGGATNLKLLDHTLPFQGAIIVSTYSLPSFPDNFKDGRVIGDQLSILTESVGELKKAL